MQWSIIVASVTIEILRFMDALLKVSKADEGAFIIEGKAAVSILAMRDDDL
jgi:hypothetical protein